MYGVWVIGNDYRSTSQFYGAYPPSYLARVSALFPDIDGSRTLHAFSGSLPAGDYYRCDSVQRHVEYVCAVEDLPARVEHRTFELVFADPPYSKDDAVKYGTPMVNRLRATRALAEIVVPGGYLVWLDTTWPQHRKSEWGTVGRILIQRSTNHRVRLCSVFQRQ